MLGIRRPRVRRLGFLALATLMLGPAVSNAQHRPVAAGVAWRPAGGPALGPDTSSWAPRATTRDAPPVATSRAERVLVGAFVGAAAGAALAFAVTHQPRIKDHGTDIVAYIYIVPLGAVVGALVGAAWPDPAPR